MWISQGVLLAFAIYGLLQLLPILFVPSTHAESTQRAQLVAEEKAARQRIRRTRLPRGWWHGVKKYGGSK